jgi:hypothetical protein
MLLAMAATAAFVVALPSMALAGSFTGTLTVFAPATAPSSGSIDVTATAQMTETCDPSGTPYEYCGWFAELTTVPAGQPCAPSVSASSWVGTDLYDTNTGPGSHVLSPAWHEWPALQSGPKTACLYARSGSADAVLVAQAGYTVPAPAAAAPVTTAPVRDYDCGDFRYQQDAQAYLLPGDPYGLDADRDGIACETLPNRPAASTTTPTAPVPSTTTPAPTVYLDVAEAVQVARGALAHRFGRAWKDGRGRKVTCPIRTSSTTMTCRATWRRRGYAYKASITVRERPSSYVTSARLLSKRPR